MLLLCPFFPRRRCLPRVRSGRKRPSSGIWASSAAACLLCPLVSGQNAFSLSPISYLQVFCLCQSSRHSPKLAGQLQWRMISGPRICRQGLLLQYSLQHSVQRKHRFCRPLSDLFLKNSRRRGGPPPPPRAPNIYSLHVPALSCAPPPPSAPPITNFPVGFTKNLVFASM